MAFYGSDRHLAVILLELLTVCNRRADAQEALGVGFDDRKAEEEASDQLARFDDEVDQLREEARFAIERDTGVTFARIEEANL